MLEVTGVSRAFGGVQALSDVSFNARPGEVTGVIGPNGAGKSTLLSCLSGWVLPDSGAATFNGESIVEVEPADLASSGCIRTFQNLELLPDSTVRENIALGTRRLVSGGLLSGIVGGRRRRAESQMAEDIVVEAAQRLDIVSLLDRPLGALSYGQRKQVELARACAAKPSLLLLDEPAAGLDDRERDALTAVIAELAADDVAVVLVEHAIEMVMALSASIVVLDFGLVVAHGRPADVRHDPRVIEAYLGASS